MYKVMFLQAAMDDGEWHLHEMVNIAWDVWCNKIVEVEGLYEHVHNAEWEETLEHFMKSGMRLWDIDKFAAKLLYDICTWKANIEAGLFDVSITHEDETFPGISHKKENCSHVALVQDDGMTELFYGFDANVMRKQLDKLFKTRYDRIRPLHVTTIWRRV